MRYGYDIRRQSLSDKQKFCFYATHNTAKLQNRAIEKKEGRENFATLYKTRLTLSGKFVILDIGHRLEPLVGSLFAGNGKSQMGKP